ncbi:MAG: hypothetical protein U9O97_01955 [Elusimicrobiota bacterium]|nr:hypothetical protein [Elusimicrobiota bacterium]
MRKKIFIIHGKGVRNGIGRETGGDLDTISSNVFYSVWAQNALKEELLRDSEYGKDYDFDFINYSEGINHLVVHKGCDVYIPDFPVDALAPRLKLVRVRDSDAVGLINKYTKNLNDFRLWIVSNALAVSDEYKDVFNPTFNQVAKITAYQDVPVLRMANDILDMTRAATELSIDDAGDEDKKTKQNALLKDLMQGFTGDRFYHAKTAVLAAMNNDIKYDMSEIVEEKEEILALDKAHSLDLSSRGRIGYTDELLILAAESVYYLARGYEQLRELPFDDLHARQFSEAAEKVRSQLKNIFVFMAEKIERAGEQDGFIKDKFASFAEKAKDALQILQELPSYKTPPAPEGGFPITVMLMEDSTGKAVSGIDIMFERLKGEGKIYSADGNELGAKSAIVKTGDDGAAYVLYKPSSPTEVFQFNVTFDGLHVMLVPEEVEAKNAAPGSSDYLADEDVDTDDEVDVDTVGDSPFAHNLSLTLIERMFRFLKENDVNVVSVDDHHPYNPEILTLLENLRDEGVIGSVQIHAAPRGIDEAPEDKKCGADLIYEKMVKGKRWDNPGLKHLRDIAHVQDLYLPRQYWPKSMGTKDRGLGIEISKLIGSSFNKIEMTMELSKLDSREALENIMSSTGWDKSVKEYEDGLEKVLPRTETNMAHMLFLRKPPGGDYNKCLSFTDKLKVFFRAPKGAEERDAFVKELYVGNPDNRLIIMAALSPFTNAKLGETKINVASAINYLLHRKKYYADYFFYCYGSQIMTTRKPNNDDETINLSTLMQHIGTKADGGHKGAATCQPLSNPQFPKKRLLKVGDRNILEFFYYIAGKVTEYAPSLELLSVKPVAVKKYEDSYEKVLEKVKYNVIEYTLTDSDTGKTIKAVLTKAPKVAKNGSENKPGITQVLEWTGRHYKPEYIFFLQGGMYSMELYNYADPLKKLNLPVLSQLVGWDEDGGCEGIAIATPKRNRRIPKDLRWLRESDFLELGHRISGYINAGDSRWKVTSVRAVTPKDAAAKKENLPPIAAHAYRMNFLRSKDADPSLPKTFNAVALMSPFVDRKAGEFELPMSLVCEELKKLKADYVVYMDWKRIQVVNLSGGKNLISCADIAEAMTGEKGEIRDIASFERSAIKGVPAEFDKLYHSKAVKFLKFFADKLSGEFGYYSDWPVSADKELASVSSYPLSEKKFKSNYRRAHNA